MHRIVVKYKYKEKKPPPSSRAASQIVVTPKNYPSHCRVCILIPSSIKEALQRLHAPGKLVFLTGGRHKKVDETSQRLANVSPSFFVVKELKYAFSASTVALPSSSLTTTPT